MEISSHLGQITATGVHPTLPTVTAFQTGDLIQKEHRGEQSTVWGKTECGDVEMWRCRKDENLLLPRMWVGHLIQAFTQRPQPQKKEIVQNALAVETLEYENIEGPVVKIMMTKSFCCSMYLSWSQCWHH